MSSRKEKATKAYADLESTICDLRDMGAVMATVIESALGDPQDKGAFKAYLLNDEQVREVFFVMYDMKRRAQALVEEFHQAAKSDPSFVP